MSYWTDVRYALRLLRKTGVRRIVMLTGDRREVAETIAVGLNIDEVLAEQTPADKLAAIRESRLRGVVIDTSRGRDVAATAAPCDSAPQDAAHPETRAKRIRQRAVGGSPARSA